MPADPPRRRRLLRFVAGLYLLALAPLYGDNENRAHALLWALDHEQQLTIAEAPFPTGDYALANGRVYAGAAPGVAFTALPAYTLVRRASGLLLSESQAEVAGYLAAILLAAVLPAWLGVWAFARASQAVVTRDAGLPPDSRAGTDALAGHHGQAAAPPLPAAPTGGARLSGGLGQTGAPPGSAGLALPGVPPGATDSAGLALPGVPPGSTDSEGLALLLFALGSLLFPFASRLMPAALVIGALSVAVWATTRALDEPARVTRWAALAGLAAAWAVCADYTAGLAAVGLAGLLLASPGDAAARGRRLGGLLLGAGPLALGLATYHALAFGSPFATAYHFPGTPVIRDAVSAGWLGYQLPTLRTLWALTGGLETGLFVYCPAAVIGVAGAVQAARRGAGGRRHLAWLALALSLAYLLLNAARLHDYHAGHAHGPRYLLVALPFLLWFLPEGLAWLPRRAALALAALSFAVAWLGVLSATHYWPQGASLLTRAADVAAAGPRLPWLFVLSRSTGAPRESLVPLVSAALWIAVGGGAAWAWRERDRPLAALGLGLAIGALALLL